MITVKLAWNAHGVVPPIAIGAAGAGKDRSPYHVSMGDLAERFGTSPERRAILIGLLELRSLLVQAGLTSGFQWIDGSFLEDVEHREGRHPNDIDVVTFADLGDASVQQSRCAEYPDLFDTVYQFHVDHFFVSFSQPTENLIERTAYWYSMWSHRKSDRSEDRIWKGFVQVALDPQDDRAASQIIADLERREVGAS